MHPPSEPSGRAELLSVGRVADATGISPATLRIWERRYGVPVPVRLESGHRRYTAEQVAWLRQVAEALQRGHRARAVLQADESELRRLVAGSAGVEEQSRETLLLLEMVREGRIEELHEALRLAYGQLGALAFLEERVAPLLRSVGRAWTEGSLCVHQEHAGSHAIGDFLSLLLLSLRAQPGAGHAGPIVLATLPEERHGLGIEMVGVLCESLGVSTAMLGPDTPIDEIVAAAEPIAAPAVGIGVSIATSGVRTDAALADLRRRLPESTELVVGGAGARRHGRRGPSGARTFDTLRELRDWLVVRFPPPPDAAGRRS